MISIICYTDNRRLQTTMASITNNSSKYGEGHVVTFNTKQSGKMLNALRELNIKPGKDEFKITLKRNNDEPFRSLDIGGNDFVMFLDSRNKLFRVTGKANSINKLFIHASSTAGASTNLLTEIKELFSMEMFRAYTLSGKVLTEEEVTELVIKKQKASKKYIKTSYYTSALKQLMVYKSLSIKGQYHFERQGGIKTKPLYALARALTNKANDNWNPADVWVIRKTYNMKSILNSESAQQLNETLSLEIKNKNIIPISLKTVNSTKASLSLVDPNDMLDQSIDLDFSFSNINISDTFNNFILSTKSDFQVRGGFKASSTATNVSLEGRMAKSKVQIGSIGAKEYSSRVKSEFNYKLRTGVNTSLDDIDIAINEMKEVFLRYRRVSNTIANYDDMLSILEDESTPEIKKLRFINLVSFVYSTLIKPKDFEEHMKHCYMLAKNLTPNSAPYYLVK